MNSPAADANLAHLLIACPAYHERNAAALRAADVLNRPAKTQLGDRLAVDREDLITLAEACLRRTATSHQAGYEERIASNHERGANAFQLNVRRLAFRRRLEIDLQRTNPSAVLEPQAGDDPAV